MESRRESHVVLGERQPRIYPWASFQLASSGKFASWKLTPRRPVFEKTHATTARQAYPSGGSVSNNARNPACSK